MSDTLYGHVVRDAPILTDTTKSTAIYIGGYRNVAIEIPTAEAGMYTATINVGISVAQKPTDSFRLFYVHGVYSSTTGLIPWLSASNQGNYFAPVPISGWNYMKIETVLSADSTTLLSRIHLSNLKNI